MARLLSRILRYRISSNDRKRGHIFRLSKYLDAFDRSADVIFDREGDKMATHPLRGHDIALLFIFLVRPLANTMKFAAGIENKNWIRGS